MKITITKTVEETHELELPAYRKNICYYFKIISETQAIQVNFGGEMESISTTYASVALNSASEVGNQEEFDTKFNEVVTVLMEKAS
jgi:hypothetical protein